MEWIAYAMIAFLVVSLVVREVAWHRLPQKHWLNRAHSKGDGGGVMGGSDSCGGDGGGD
ncbi:hypothetical protein [uncultured Sulfitobacter sp.]|uniref:hypothetical protein n=1 Tax=uncultured Sulfitobacter sp. TaxID=191468 RepID=UPI00260355E4|nr:hypothetical protein [uncultured Sulfitobacter sp.]